MKSINWYPNVKKLCIPGTNLTWIWHTAFSFSSNFFRDFHLSWYLRYSFTHQYQSYSMTKKKVILWWQNWKLYFIFIFGNDLYKIGIFCSFNVAWTSNIKLSASGNATVERSLNYFMTRTALIFSVITNSIY